MHPSTEDLLSVRDGEPVDSEIRAAITGDVAQSREVERLRSVRHALRGLPELAAPDGVWERIAAAEREARPRIAPWRQYAAGAGIAATVAAVAIFVIGSLSRPPGGHATPPTTAAGNRFTTSTVGEPPSTVVGSDTPFDPDGLLVGGRVVPASYPALVQESERLDRALRRLPRARPMMSAETAATIAGLEDRIALIDEQITYGNARGVPQPQRVALWGERVDLMNALVHVRYAQAQPLDY
ncbi:MAG TPA: hypothetical protein VMV37_01335 [Gammaproteobacteria bacterium]|nr:hypothetical protein [Gammaproteobacteria bacterium]